MAVRKLLYENESVVANAAELKRLVLRGKNSSFDFLMTDYDFHDFFFKATGTLLADNCPIRYSRLFCTRWNAGWNKNTGKRYCNKPSTRRNSISADIFGRLGYMESQGSGLNKIRKAYKNAANNQMGMEPEFCSDRVMFMVTLKNLNYEIMLTRTSCPYPAPAQGQHRK